MRIVLVIYHLLTSVSLLCVGFILRSIMDYWSFCSVFTHNGPLMNMNRDRYTYTRCSKGFDDLKETTKGLVVKLIELILGQGKQLINSTHRQNTCQSAMNYWKDQCLITLSRHRLEFCQIHHFEILIPYIEEFWSCKKLLS